MLGYTIEDIEDAKYGIRLALDALSDNPATYSKEDIQRIRGLAKDGLKVANDIFDGLISEGHF
jgi:hypothetical protein